MKRSIKVFPDYMSSGLWDENGSNMHETELSDVIPNHLLIALKYWHWVWEILQDDNYRTTMSEGAFSQWNEDGKAIVNAMNACQDKFDFIYIE